MMVLQKLHCCIVETSPCSGRTSYSSSPEVAAKNTDFSSFLAATVCQPFVAPMDLPMVESSFHGLMYHFMDVSIHFMEGCSI